MCIAERNKDNGNFVRQQIKPEERGVSADKAAVIKASSVAVEGPLQHLFDNKTKNL